MNKNYRYEGARLKPKIAKKLILELLSGKTVSRREIDKAIIHYHESQGGLLSTAKTSPIRTALRYLQEKGLAENLSKGPGSTWRIHEPSNSTPCSIEPVDT